MYKQIQAIVPPELVLMLWQSDPVWKNTYIIQSKVDLTHNKHNCGASATYFLVSLTFSPVHVDFSVYYKTFVFICSVHQTSSEFIPPIRKGCNIQTIQWAVRTTEGCRTSASLLGKMTEYTYRFDRFAELHERGTGSGYRRQPLAVDLQE